jgi:hypothetical protein
MKGINIEDKTRQPKDYGHCSCALWINYVVLNLNLSRFADNDYGSDNYGGVVSSIFCSLGKREEKTEG